MKILIIGGDAAGMSAASQIRRRERDWDITVLEQGDFTSYSACGIPYFFAGDVAAFEDLVVVTPEEFIEKRKILVKMRHRATRIDPEKKLVEALGPQGETLSFEYDRLMIATGASPILPPWPGMELTGVTALRNLEDTQVVQKLLQRKPKKCVVVGGGYIGLEMVEAFHRLGLKVTLLEKLSGLMGNAEPLVTDGAMAAMKAQGIEVHLETTVQGFSGKEGQLTTVETDQGSFSADLALISLGVKPNAELAKAAAITIGDTGAIMVDRQQRTSDPCIFAAGDCAETHHLVLDRNAYIPLALNANRAGRIAGANISGAEETFPGTLGSAVTKVFDFRIARTGLDAPTLKKEKMPYEEVTIKSSDRADYMKGSGPMWVKIFYHPKGHQILGAWVVGEDDSAGKRCDIIATAISAKLTLGQLADLDLCYAPPFSGVWDPVLQAANKARFSWMSV